MGTGECRRTVLSQPIYDALGPTKAAALINWHASTGCDTNGHIRGKGKQTCFKAFMTSPPDVVSSVQMLGEGDSPSEKVLDGCEAFLCSPYCPNESSFQEPVTLDGISLKYETRTTGGQTATNPRGLKAAHSACPPTGQYLGPGSR